MLNEGDRAALKAVAFDVDATLLDFLRFKEIAARAAALAMVDAGLELDPWIAEERLWETYKTAGLDGDVAFERFLQTTVGHVNPAVLAAGLRTYLRVKEAVLEPYPGTMPTLIGLVRRGLRLAVITDAPRNKAMDRLAAVRLRPFFDEVITLDDTLRGKADEAPYRMLLQRLGCEPREVLMVGDNPERDVRTAKRAGLWTAQAMYGAQPHYATAFPFDKADFELRRIEDVVRVVDGLREPKLQNEIVGPLAAA